MCMYLVKGVHESKKSEVNLSSLCSREWNVLMLQMKDIHIHY